MRKTMNLIEAISKLDARLLRDEQGHEIKGPYWVNRNDVIELLLAAQTPSPAAPLLLHRFAKKRRVARIEEKL
jgi:hypothetical protein